MQANNAGYLKKTNSSTKIEDIQKEFNNSQSGNKKVSLADLIVLAGCAGVEKAAKDAGHKITAPFIPGRMDSSDDQTDAESFDGLEPDDGFRNYQKKSITEHVLKK